MPTRYQRKRERGYKLPAGVKCVTRPGPWGNPFNTAAEFEHYLTILIDNPSCESLAGVSADQFRRLKWMAENLDQLRDLDLACFCPTGIVGCYVLCHADVLIRLANRVVK